jgi:hypothetical protein
MKTFIIESVIQTMLFHSHLIKYARAKQKENIHSHVNCNFTILFF